MLISFQLISGLELFFANGPYSYCYRAAGLNQRFLHLKFAIDSRVVLIYSWTMSHKYNRGAFIDYELLQKKQILCAVKKIT